MGEGSLQSSPQNGWESYSKLVLAELARLSRELDSLHADLLLYSQHSDEKINRNIESLAVLNERIFNLQSKVSEDSQSVDSKGKKAAIAVGIPTAVVALAETLKLIFLYLTQG